MTVAEMITWLKTQDQEASVFVVEHTSGTGYYDQGGNAREVVFDPAKHVDYTDRRAFTKEDDPCHNQRSLLLGVHDG